MRIKKLKMIKHMGNTRTYKLGFIFFSTFSVTACQHLLPPPKTEALAKPVLPKQFNNTHENSHAQQNLNSQKNAYANLPADWWLVFKDKELNKLVGMALMQNADLASSFISLKKAQLHIQSANNATQPKYSMGISANARKALPFNQQNRVSNKISQSYGASLGVGYEVDLWNKLALSKDVAQWQANASAEDIRGVKLAQTTQVALQYWQIGYLNAQLAMTEQSVAHAKETLRIVSARYKAGAVARMDVVNAKNSLLNARMQLQPLLDNRQQARNTLAILLNKAPINTSFVNELQSLPRFNMRLIPKNIPANILYNRPDIASAEWRLRSTLTNVEIARKAFYPSLSINASVGTGGSILLDILKNPVGSVALAPVLPFLNHSQNSISHASAKLDYEQAVVNFQKQLYTALGEVENSLAKQRSLSNKQHDLHTSLSNAKQLARMQKVRYFAGEDDLQSWLNAQASVRQAERTLLDNRYALYQNFARLFVALGGSSISNT